MGITTKTPAELFSAGDGKTKPVAAKLEKFTAAQIRGALKQYFPHPEFGIVFEVAQSTGHAAHRHLDAIAMDTWPSRGLTVYGIEIKVDRYDWLREKRNPEKAEQLARFCDVFFIAAPKGVVPIEELPQAWGLLELEQLGKPLVLRRPAAKTDCQPPTKAFMAAIFRAAGRAVDPGSIDGLLSEQRTKLEAEFDQRVKDRAERISTNNSEDAIAWRKLTEEFGNDPDSFKRFYSQDSTRLIAVIKAVRDAGVMETWHGLNALSKTIEDFSAKLVKACADLHVPDNVSVAGGIKTKKKARGRKS